MKRTPRLGVSILVLSLLALPRRAEAQIVVIDDVILMTSRQKKQQQERAHQHLDPPGGEFLLSPSPGADEPRLGEERMAVPLFPSPLSRRGRRRGQRRAILRSQPGVPLDVPDEESALSGPVEWTAEDEGPSGGLSFDAAVERLLAVNSDLAAMFHDIPKARADILTAGLRSNPFLFVSVSNIPYGSYSPQRPGATLYDLTVIQPLDLNGKGDQRIRAAQEAKQVLEAQYQDAVRQKIDRLNQVFTNVLEARQAVTALRAGLNHTALLTKEFPPRTPASIETEISVEQLHGEVALQRAETMLLQARRELALLLEVPAEQADSLAVCGTLHDRAPTPPCTEELIPIALACRPDLAAYRLGKTRALADLRRERSEAIDDVFLFYTPFTATDFSPQGKQSASGWSLGLLMPLPLFDRNQGDIRRARYNVTQTELERDSLERRIVNEVRYAATEYSLSLDVVRQYEAEILPSAHRLRDEKERLFREGKESFPSFHEIQQEYEEAVRDYLEALVYHRRCMFRLNTAVGQRILP